MKVGVVGTGFVFDHYMTTMLRHSEIEIVGIFDLDAARLEQVATYYGLTAYASTQALLDDPNIDCIANFTSINAHAEVTRAALMAGKHVYCEKPFTPDLSEAQALMALAEEKGLRVSAAPSNVLSATVQTLWRGVLEGHAGKPQIVYAEFDDNPIYLLKPETWKNRSGAPWPYAHEYEMGCTWEHAGYHLNWMCALFGPVDSMTAFSTVTVPHKTDLALNPSDTPDFSVATLRFASGVVGRLTCSIAVPSDHRMRVFCEKGQITADTYRDYNCPVYQEIYTDRSLKARNQYSVRQSPLLQRLLGANGKRRALEAPVHPGAHQDCYGDGSVFSPKAALQRLKRRQYGHQDKAAGLVELSRAIDEDRPHFPPHAFTLHLTELTLAIQAAGPDGASHTLETRFDPKEFPSAVMPTT